MKNAAALSDVQHATLAYIRQYIDENHYPPAIRNIADHFGIGTTAVWDRLHVLVRKGFIQRTPNISRSIRVMP